jgi:hypothetical protein
VAIAAIQFIEFVNFAHYCPVKDNTKPPEVLKIKG